MQDGPQAAPDDRLAGTCMLTVVHEPDFPHLHHRLQATYALARGKPPTTVVVFDDHNASREFRSRYPESHSKAVALSLRAMIGEHDYETARSVLGRNPPVAKYNPGTPGTYHPNEGCGYSATGGRNYQSLKKFYGAIYGPAYCSLYWVSDAETWPFREYDFATLVAPMASSLPFVLATSWYPNRWGCTRVLDSHKDAGCAEFIASHLKLDRFWDMPNTPSALMATARPRKFLQTKFDLNNWWYYEPRMVRAMIAHAERASGMRFVDLWVALRVSDAAFWRYALE